MRRGLLRIYLIPDVGHARVVVPRIERMRDEVLGVGVHEAGEMMIHRRAINEVEVVVFRSDTREAIKHEIVRRK